MLVVIEIAGREVRLCAKGITIVRSAGPHRRYPGRGRTRAGSRPPASAKTTPTTATAATASAAPATAKNILGSKILFVDIIRLCQNGHLLIAVKAVEIYTFIIVFIRSGAGHEFSEIAFPAVLLCDDVDCLDPVAIIKAGKFTLIAEVVKDLDLVDDIGRQVAGRQLGIITEETFSIHHYPGNRLTLRRDIPAFVYLYARHLL